MKNPMIAALVLLLTTFGLSQAQDRVRERDLRGEWEMVIDIDEKDIEDEIETDSWFGWMVANSVSDFVVDIIEEIDIRMEFEDRGELIITVNAFGNKEIEKAEWYINRDGQLVITDSDDDDDDDVWMFVGDKLVLFEKSKSGRLSDQPVYMVRR